MRIVSTLVVGIIGYSAFHAYAAIVPCSARVFWALYPIFNLAVGVFIGYRLPRYGWAYAAVPIAALTAILCLSGWKAATYLWLPYKLPVGLFPAMLGGFVGERLVHQR